MEFSERKNGMNRNFVNLLDLGSSENWGPHLATVLRTYVNLYNLNSETRKKVLT